MRDWEREYKDLLQRALSKGDVEPLKEQHEHRSSPRFPLAMGSVWIRAEMPFDVVDMSPNGMAFLSDRLFSKGQHLALTLGKAFLVEARVVHCTMVETDEDLMEAKYRISCEFNDPHNGRQALMLLKEMEEAEKNRDHSF